MTTEPTSPTKRAMYTLNDRCESVLTNLRALIEIHRGIDASVDWRIDADPTYRTQIHRAFVHLCAVASWRMDGDVFHVMVPEIRAAEKALRPLVQDMQPDSLASAGGGRHSLLWREADLALFAHPTPASLSLGREKGGLANRGYVRYLLLAYFTLLGLMLTYAVALAEVAALFDPEKVEAITEMIAREREAGQALDLEALLKVADD